MENKILSVELAPQMSWEDVPKYNTYRNVPLNKDTTEENQDGVGFFAATMIRSVPHKIGVWMPIAADNMIRAFNDDDDLQSHDPTFDPIKAWKEGNHSPEEMAQIGRMTNWDQYHVYNEVRNMQMNAQRAVDEAGFVGAAADFLINVGTDPTTYAGFGAARMLSKGLSSAKAYSIAAAGAAATSEAIEQATDLGDMRDASQSMITIGSSALFGGLLGGAVDVWAKKANGKPFSEFSNKVVSDAITIEDRAKSLSAAAVENDPEASKVWGKIAYGAARMYSFFRLSPSVTGQVAAEDASRKLSSKFFENTLMTKGEAGGAAREVSLAGQHLVEEAEYIGKITDLNDTVIALQKGGKKIDDATFEEAYSKAINGELDDTTPSGIIATKMRSYFDSFAEKMDGADGFELRQNYIPSKIDANKVNMNLKEFIDTVEVQWKRAANFAKEDLKKIEWRLHQAEKEMEGIGDPLVKGRLQKTINRLYDEREKLSYIANRTQDELTSDASDFAAKVASGDMNIDRLMSPMQDKVYPAQFMERMLDQKLFSPFLEKNPFVLMHNYGRGVSPYVASYKVFGEINPSTVIDDYVAKMSEKVTKSQLAKDDKLATKLAKERDRIKENATNAWNDLTGQTYIDARKYMGQTPYNIVQTAKSYTSAVSLGNSTMASLNELAAPMIVHGLKGQVRFIQALSKMATSPSVRALSKKNKRSLAHAMNTALHRALAGHYTQDLANQAVINSSKSGKIAKAMQITNSYSQILNGQVPYTNLVRDTLRLMQEDVLSDSISALASGKAKKNIVSDLAHLGIDEFDAKRIATLAKQHGERVDGIFTFNLEKWGDHDLANIMKLVLIRDNRRTSLNPTVGDIPHIFRVPGFDLLFQFKSWATTAGHTYGIASLQRMDAQHLMGISTYIGFSSLAYMLNEAAKGNDVSTDVDEMLYAGVTNSGILGVLPDYGGHWLMNTMFDLESGGARYAEKNNMIEQSLGPAYSKARNIWEIKKPVMDAIDPDKEADINDKFYRNLLDALPVPFVKPYIKNELLKDQ